MGSDQVRRTLGGFGTVAGLLGMWGVGFVAPPQPEYMHRGGACDIAPCGTLEDPATWLHLWRPFVAFFLVYAVSLFLLLWERSRKHRGRSSSVAPALVVMVFAMAGTFLAEVYGSLTSFHMGVAMAIASAVPIGFAAASLIPEGGGALSAAVALLQAFCYAIPRVGNEFVVLVLRSEPFPSATYLWTYIVAVGIFLGGASLQKWVLSRDELLSSHPSLP